MTIDMSAPVPTIDFVPVLDGPNQMGCMISRATVNAAAASAELSLGQVVRHNRVR